MTVLINKYRVRLDSMIECKVPKLHALLRRCCQQEGYGHRLHPSQRHVLLRSPMHEADIVLTAGPDPCKKKNRSVFCNLQAQANGFGSTFLVVGVLKPNGGDWCLNAYTRDVLGIWEAGAGDVKTDLGISCSGLCFNEATHILRNLARTTVDQAMVTRNRKAVVDAIARVVGDQDAKKEVKPLSDEALARVATQVASAYKGKMQRERRIADMYRDNNHLRRVAASRQNGKAQMGRKRKTTYQLKYDSLVLAWEARAARTGFCQISGCVMH